jgi:hypothetical protein
VKNTNKGESLVSWQRAPNQIQGLLVGAKICFFFEKISNFTQMPLKHELQNIISRNGFVRNGEVIQTITDYLRAEKKAVSNFKEGKLSKVKETEVMTIFIQF